MPTIYICARADIDRRLTEEGTGEAIILLQKALAIDSAYAPAAAMIGWCRNLRRIQGWDPGSVAETAEAVRLARLAIDTGRDDPDALSMAAIALMNFARDSATAESAADRALTLNPNSAFAWGIALATNRTAQSTRSSARFD